MKTRFCETRQSTKSLLTVHNKTGFFVPDFNFDIDDPVTLIFNFDAADESDDQCIRKKGIVSSQVVSDFLYVRRDLMTLKATQLSIFLTTNSLNFREIPDLFRSRRKCEHIMLRSL